MTAIDRTTLTFDDPAAERRFRAEHDNRATHTTRLAVALGAPGYLLMLLIVEDATARWVAAGMLVSLALWFGLAGWDAYSRHYDAFTAGALTVTTGLFIVMVLQLPPDAALVIGDAALAAVGLTTGEVDPDTGA